MAQLTITADPAEVRAVLDAPWEQGDNAPGAAAAVAAIPTFPVPDPIKKAFWAWYDAHAEDVILKKHILFFTVVLKVKHLQFLFALFFGPHP